MHDTPLEITLFDKQIEAFQSTARSTAYVGGIQCGKSTVGGLWLLCKTFENPQPDDAFIIAAPNYKTVNQATLPAFLRFARGYGHYRDQKAEFQLHTGGTVFIRTATDPESLEGITNVKAAWGDEAGLMSRYFKENMEGRCAFKEAPIMWTTTPYSMNWLAEEAKNALAKKTDPRDFKLVQLRSIDSPYFPKAEYERQRKKLDPRRFAMKYEGQFGQMQGLVYETINLCKSFPLPAGAVNFGAIDWGHTDPFVLLTRAVIPDGRSYTRDEYYKVGLIASEIMELVQARHQIYQYRQVFCDPSRPEYIEELNRRGVPAVAADNRIRLGIDVHTELIRRELHWVFEDMCPHTIDEYRTYHYAEPEELGFDDDQKEMEPVAASDHSMDCERYASSGIRALQGNNGQKYTPRAAEERGKKSEMQRLKELMRPKRNVSF